MCLWLFKCGKVKSLISVNIIFCSFYNNYFDRYPAMTRSMLVIRKSLKPMMSIKSARTYKIV